MHELRTSPDKWALRQLSRSSRPLQFWQAVADVVSTDRDRLGRDPSVPLQPYGYSDRAAGEVLVGRNLHGVELERSGRLEEACLLYEANLADLFDGTHPYDRLRISYAREGLLRDAIRVCEAYLSLPPRPVGQDRPHFSHHLERLREKLASAAHRPEKEL